MAQLAKIMMQVVEVVGLLSLMLRVAMEGMGGILILLVALVALELEMVVTVQLRIIIPLLKQVTHLEEAVGEEVKTPEHRQVELTAK